HSRPFHFIEVGLAGGGGSPSVSGDEEVVWHAGEQLRGGGRVWPKNSCACHNGRGRERPSGISALQRRIGAVQHRRFARGLFLSRATEGTHGQGISSGKLNGFTFPARRKHRPICVNRFPMR